MQTEEGSSGEPGDRGLTAAVLAWHLVVIVALTWFPFALADPALPAPTRLLTSAWDVVANLLLFVPFAAAVVGARAASSPARPRARAWRAAAIAAIASAIVEIGQRFVDGRFASSADVVLNAGGALAAGFVANAALAAGVKPRAMIAGSLIGVFVVVSGYLLGSAISVNRAFRLAGWDPTYPVLVGDEFGTDRRYVGEVWDGRMCAGSPPDRVCVAPGAPPEARAALIAAAERSQSIELTATVRSKSDDQTGPTRIVSFSRGGYERNVTLGQEGRALVFRLRTPWTGPNGREPEIHLPDAVPAGVTTAVAASFTRGTVVMAAETAAGTRSQTLRTGLLEAWSLVGFDEGERSRTRIVPVHASRAAVPAAVVLFWPLGMLVARLVPRRRAAVSAAAITGAAALLLADSLLGTGPALRPVFFGAGSAALAALLSARRAPKGHAG